jgi:hypothetical protein
MNGPVFLIANRGPGRREGLKSLCGERSVFPGHDVSHRTEEVFQTAARTFVAALHSCGGTKPPARGTILQEVASAARPQRLLHSIAAY